MTWVNLLLLFLRIVDSILTTQKEKGLISQGQDEEIARSTAAILKKTEFAKDALRKITALPEPDVDRLLRDLEPK